MNGVLGRNRFVNADAQRRFAASPCLSSRAGYVQRLGIARYAHACFHESSRAN